MGSSATLWLAVIASGIFHGINPGMGWPLAVSAGLMDRRAGALFVALVSLAIGHFLAIGVMILPFALLITLVAWQASIQVTTGLGVMGFGLYKLYNRRHARLLARIKPTQLALWSFVVAIAHGAGLMLVPIYLGLCQVTDSDQGHVAAKSLMNSSVGMAAIVVAVHATSMIATAGLAAWACYRYLGLKFISRSWFNVETVWAMSLLIVGALGLLTGLRSFDMARARYWDTEYEESIAVASQLRQSFPNFRQPHNTLIAALGQVGRAEGASEVPRRSRDSGSLFALSCRYP